MFSGQVEIAGEVDSDFLGLLAREIEEIEEAAILEDDGIGAEAGPVHIELGEMGELADLLRLCAVSEEIHAVIGALIGVEIDGVAAPHWKSVHALIVAVDLLVVIGLEIVDGNFLGHAAGVTLPGAEIAEDAIEGDLIAVGREGSEAAFVDGEARGKAAFDGNREEAAEPGIESFAAGEEQDALAVGHPIDDFIFHAHALGQNDGGSFEGQLLGLAAFGGNYVDVGIAVILAGEGDV